jgi:hypothetical protein
MSLSLTKFQNISLDQWTVFTISPLKIQKKELPSNKEALLIFHLNRTFLAQGRVVDHEAITNIALQHALIRGVDILDFDHFNVRSDVVFGAEI